MDLKRVLKYGCGVEGTILSLSEVWEVKERVD